MNNNKYKLIAVVTIGFAALGLWTSFNSIYHNSFKGLDDYEKITGKLERTVLISPTTSDKDFHYTDSYYLGLKLKSDSIQYTLNHPNLDLNKVQSHLTDGTTVTLYYQSENDQRSVKQLEQNQTIVIRFTTYRNYLTRSSPLVFVPQVDLVPAVF